MLKERVIPNSGSSVSNGKTYVQKKGYRQLSIADNDSVFGSIVFFPSDTILDKIQSRNIQHLRPDMILIISAKVLSDGRNVYSEGGRYVYFKFNQETGKPEILPIHTGAGKIFRRVHEAVLKYGDNGITFITSGVGDLYVRK